MANWKEAWRVLWSGLPEPEKAEPEPPKEIYVRGEPVELYAVVEATTAIYGRHTVWRSKSYHHTCEQAFASAGESNQVNKVRAYRDGNDYYKEASVVPITVTPKPKRAKGAK